MTTEVVTMDIGNNIRLLRIQKGLNQKQLAERSGISPSYLCDLEKGRFDGSIRVLQCIAAALDVNVSELLK